MSVDLLVAVGEARSLLFVPGDRPERFAKAVGSGAGLVVLDLEDAVGLERRQAARASVRAALCEDPGLAVRINAAASPEQPADLEALAGIRCAVMLAKACSYAEIDSVAAVLAPGSVVIALVETASGVLAAAALAGHPSVARLAFGSLDLATELGVSPDDPDALLPCRGALVLASAAAGIAGPVDGVTAAVDDEDRLRADVGYARSLGFTGRLCIHPRQVPVTEEVLAPTNAELAWAERIIAAVERSSGDVLLVDGAMVDKPVVDRARRILGAAATRGA
jgi:citrate lyase subunit beta / citryl-CoA lyase